jgi:hypothetical protein
MLSKSESRMIQLVFGILSFSANHAFVRSPVLQFNTATYSFYDACVSSLFIELNDTHGPSPSYC